MYFFGSTGRASRCRIITAALLRHCKDIDMADAFLKTKQLVSAILSVVSLQA